MTHTHILFCDGQVTVAAEILTAAILSGLVQIKLLFSSLLCYLFSCVLEHVIGAEAPEFNLSLRPGLICSPLVVLSSVILHHIIPKLALSLSFFLDILSFSLTHFCSTDPWNNACGRVKICPLMETRIHLHKGGCWQETL